MTEEELVAAYNSLCGELPVCRGLDDRRRHKVKALLSSLKEDDWIAAILKAAKSSRLLGKTEGFHVATFDWFLNPTNIRSVLEGAYDDPKTPEAPMRPAAEQTEYWNQPKPPALLFSRSQMAVVRAIGEEMLAEERRTKKKTSPTQEQLRRLDAAWDPLTGTKKASEWLEIMEAARSREEPLFSDIWDAKDMPKPEKPHLQEVGSTDEDAPF